MADDQTIEYVPTGSGEAFEQLVLGSAPWWHTTTSEITGEGPNILFSGVNLLALRALAYRIELNASLALENDDSMRFLGRLMETRVIERGELGDSMETSQALGLALGAAAQLFDVDSDALRISPAGEALAKKWAPGSDE